MQEPEGERPILTVEVVEGGRGPRLVLAGDLDLDGAKVLDRVVEAQAGSIELDLSRVEFIDSSGLRSLLAHRAGRGAVVVEASQAVTRICELAAVTFIFDFDEPEVSPA